MSVLEEIKILEQLKNGLFQKDFLLSWEKSDNELRVILELAMALKKIRAQKEMQVIASYIGREKFFIKVEVN